MQLKFTVLCLLMVALPACGGGSNGSDGVLIEGSLIQGESSGHLSSLRHGANVPLENIRICALNECGTTDSEGLFGFIIGELPPNGTFALTIVGHGLDTAAEVSVPAGSSDISLELIRSGTNEVQVHSVTVDGTPVDSGHDNHHE